MIYIGSEFPEWQGDAFLGALSGEALVRVDLDGTEAAKAEQWDLGQQVREVGDAGNSRSPSCRPRWSRTAA